MGLFGRDRCDITTRPKPVSHLFRIEDLALLHHRGNERLGHSVTPTAGAVPLFPADRTLDRHRTSCADKAAHKAPVIIVVGNNIDL